MSGSATASRRSAGSPAPTGELLARLARASHALAPAEWSEEDTRVYARARVEAFAADRAFLRAIVEAARGR